MNFVSNAALTNFFRVCNILHEFLIGWIGREVAKFEGWVGGKIEELHFKLPPAKLEGDITETGKNIWLSDGTTYDTCQLWVRSPGGKHDLPEVVRLFPTRDRHLAASIYNAPPQSPYQHSQPTKTTPAHSAMNPQARETGWDSLAGKLKKQVGTHPPRCQNPHC